MSARPGGRLVTFDLFSALIDSRTGGTRHFGSVAVGRGWATSGEALYDEWDHRNKASQKETVEWLTFAEHSRRALSATYRHNGLEGAVDADTADLLASMSHWPLWPDVDEGLSRLSALCDIGILSNVDDAVFDRTRVAPLVDPSAVLTSERLGAYKPAPAIYRRALERAGERSYVHVATSARDVRGAVEAGIPVIRLVRPGHVVDPAGPLPALEARSVDDVGDMLA